MASTKQLKESNTHEQIPSLTPHSISFSEKRAVQRKLTQVTSDITIHTFNRSLQTIPVNDNLSKLKRLRDSTKSIVLHNKVDALSCVLEDLLYQHCDLESIGPTIYERYTSKRANGIIDFQVGLDIYADFIGAPLYVRKDDLSTRFKDDLLDPVHGIRCIVYNPHNSEKKYIILDSNGVDIVGILHRIADDFEDAENIRVRVRANIDYAYINTALLTLDTEHDRSIVKCILAKLIGRSDMIAVGINPDIA
ncbi:LRRC8 [Mytilus coruscus]|uniref:LRRC8 n=1 Tax=Mytilus coruscus TaxID=42192 RepID=A0A6J8BPD4_MYTCO|nr:LRRC8 [Mytilus coruscus]